MMTRSSFPAIGVGTVCSVWLACLACLPGCTASTGDGTDFGSPGDGMQDSAPSAHSGSSGSAEGGGGSTGASAGTRSGSGSMNATVDAGGQNSGSTADSSVQPSMGGMDAGGTHPGMTGMDASMMTSSSDASGDTGANATGETGRLVGMTAAHNAVRAKVMTTPALPMVTWSQTVADYAQQWATMLASNPSTCTAPVHRSQSELGPKNYGENLAAFFGGGFGVSQGGNLSTAQQAVDSWASEVMCWTYGAFMTSDQCNTSCYQNLHSDGCGHYTQIVWRSSIEIGCGVATCTSNGQTSDIWIC